MKNKSTLLLVLAVVVLGVFSYFIMNEEEGGSKAMSDFAIENVEDIDKIVITESNKNQAVLIKEDGEWRLNDKFKARPSNVELLLETFRTIAVQSSVSKEKKKTVVANMAARHKKVQIYVNGSLEKTYYVGSPTKDHYGTYMLLEKDGVKSSEPYVMHKPGFNGFLESRFYTNEDDWKFSGVFVYKPSEVKQVKVQHNGELGKSFIINQNDKQVSLSDYSGVPIAEFNKALVENYILQYEKLYYNRAAELTEVQKDSVMNVPASYTVSVTDNNNNVKTVNFILKKSASPDLNPVTGEVKEYDDNHIYGFIEGENELYLFQYFALGNMLTTKEYFLQK